MDWRARSVSSRPEKRPAADLSLSLEEVEVLEGKTPQHILESGKTTERQNYLNIETKNLQKNRQPKIRSL